MNYHQYIYHRLIELRRGITSLAVLLHLRAENHGYGIRKVLSDFGLDLTEGTLYPLLRRLEEQGMLAARWDASGDRLRKYYVLTGPGTEAVTDMAKQWRELVAIVEAIDGSVRHAVLTKETIGEICKGGVYERIE